MDPNPTQIAHDLPPFFRIHSTGRVDRYREHDFVPPSHDPKTGVVSRDVVISPENNVSARIYLPKFTENDRKLPLIVYIHGGAFSIESAFSSTYHPYINSLASESRSVVVSVEYRLAPEHPIPACYDDCFEALKWIYLHSRGGNGPDPWLNDHADFDRVYMAGDSAGANIVHNIAIRVNTGTGFIKFAGLILVHPFFGIGKPDNLWNFICPGTVGADDVRLHPMADMELLSKLGCKRVLIFVGEADSLRERGWKYYEGLKRSGWKGEVEFVETPGEDHVFHLFNPDCDKAVSLMKRMVEFINHEVQEILSNNLHVLSSMDPNPTQITHDCPFFRVYSNGRVERSHKFDFVPPSHDHKTGVVSRDVVISPENNVSARIYLPKTTENNRKLPLIVYIHGGAFSNESAFSSLYHPYINSLASESRSVVVSVEYRLAPEHPLPACYDDCFEALKWIDLHSRGGNGPDPWLNDHADFDRVYMAGDSAGANIVHNIAIRANTSTGFIKIAGLILIHPFFGIGEPDSMWNFICPGTVGADDVRLHPMADMELLSKLGCERVLICVGEADSLRERGWKYYEGLKRSGWKGDAEFVETPGEDHVFHLFNPDCDKAFSLMNRMVEFIDHEAQPKFC